MTVRPTAELEEVCAGCSPQVAILCIPKEAAPALVERLIAQGVRGFWNFSHYDITYHHPGLVVENVHLGDSLMTPVLPVEKGITAKTARERAVMTAPFPGCCVSKEENRLCCQKSARPPLPPVWQAAGQSVRG